MEQCECGSLADRRAYKRWPVAKAPVSNIFLPVIFLSIAFGIEVVSPIVACGTAR